MQVRDKIIDIPDRVASIFASLNQLADDVNFMLEVSEGFDE